MNGLLKRALTPARRTNLGSVTIAAAFAPILASPAPAIAATEHNYKVIYVLEVANSDCYFFRLDGVAQADPIVPNSPWFAIPREQAGAKEMFAILLAKRASAGTLLRVLTDGGVACGAARVLTIDM